MRWYHYVAYFFGGAFLANALPHLGNGISGHAFQSPFASPPGVGDLREPGDGRPSETSNRKRILL